MVVAVVEVAEGAAEDGVDAGAGAVVRAFGGGVAKEEVDGSAEIAVVEEEGPTEMAGAEDGEVEGPLAAADDFDDEGAEGGVGVGGGEFLAEGEGFGFEVRGHGFGDGFVAPVVGVFGALGGRCWC